MGQSLQEYAAQHPEIQQMAEREAAQQAERAASYAKAQEKNQQAAEQQEKLQAEIEPLKASMVSQLRQGQAPETVLYTAIHVIGRLTNDSQFETESKAALEKQFARLAQPSLFATQATVDAARWKEQYQGYISTLSNSLTRQKKRMEKLEKEIQDLLDKLTEESTEG